jgi:hypothetical protein
MLAVCTMTLAPMTAAAESTGAIEGKVTVAGTGMAIEADQVCVTELTASGSGPAEIGPGCARTNAAGEYTISGLPSGEYKVVFTNDAMCSVKEYAVSYVAQYYDDKSSATEANPVRVIAPTTISGIDASIVAKRTEAAERPTIEYLCNQGQAKPVGESTGSAPGAIHPPPVNRQVEEEFWANPPWQKRTTTGSSTTAMGSSTVTARLAVVARTARVKDGTALLSLDCTSTVGCTGQLRLLKSITEKHGARRGRRVRNVVIGTARFSLSTDSTKKLRVHLTAKGRELLSKAGTRGLDVELTGSGVESGTLVLR